MLNIYFDYRSPFVILISQPIRELEQRLGFKARWIPIRMPELISYRDRPMGNNYPKRATYMALDLHRWARRRGLEIRTPGPLLSQRRPGEIVRGRDHPLNTEPLLRLAAVMAETPGFDAFNDAALELVWSRGMDPAGAGIVHQLIQRGVIDADTIQRSEWRGKDSLASNTLEADEQGVFGVPTFFVGKDMFWGNDRLEFVEEALESAMHCR